MSLRPDSMALRRGKLDLADGRGYDLVKDRENAALFLRDPPAGRILEGVPAVLEQ
jgi:hypothetical protein